MSIAFFVEKVVYYSKNAGNTIIGLRLYRFAIGRKLFMEEKKIIYYDDELNNEFSSAQIVAKKIGDDYVYIHSGIFKKFTHFFWYRVVATPIAFFYLKIKFHHKIINRKILKKFKDKGYFMFGNHTQPTGDAVIPSMITFSKDAYVIVHPNNVSMPYLGRVTPSMGALPLPDTLKATINFSKAIETRVKENKALVIYPEAHIWPYYTGIRPFKDDSFYYPVKYDAPVFCFTNTYQKRKHGSKPNLVTYVDGPFYRDKSKSIQEQRKLLRDQVYECMTERSKLSNVNVIEYRKKETL